MLDRVLVTGGAGFIGSHVTRALVDRGARVRVLDNLATGKRLNLFAVEDRIEFLQGDLRDPEACSAACRGVQVVFHLAALGSVARSVEDPVTTNNVNVGGTLNLLVAARDQGARRIVFSSSSSVYGNTPVFPKQERGPLCPCSPYAVSKLAGEEYCRVFHQAYGMETVALRYFNVFGPRQDPNSQYAAVIPSFIARLLGHQEPHIYGDGLQSRDFTYVSNVVEANLLAAEAPEAPGRVFNIACGEEVSLRRILERLGALLGCEPRPRYLEPRAGDVRRSLADISAAREGLGYEPRVGFTEGLSRTLDAYREAGLPSSPSPDRRAALRS